MRYNNPGKKNSTVITRVVCGLCFLAFSFLWLYEFQADALAVAQHVLSAGATHYDRLVGAVLITLVLFLLQLGIAAITRLGRRTHALTYLPSMLVLAVISDINPDIDRQFSFGAWLWAVPLVLVVWGGAGWLSRQLLPFENDQKQSTGFFSRRMWVNLAQMVAMMLLVAMASNTHAVFHYRAHAETALARGDAGDALRVGDESLETDSALTMLRVFALSKEGQLGQRLFHYAVQGNSESILPSHTPLLLLSADSIWKHLGGRPAVPLDAAHYYHYLEIDSMATPAVADYRLCGYLLDRNLNAFVKALPRYYEVGDSLPLPRHYQEALILYRHQCTRPQLVYYDAVVDEDWENMQDMLSRYDQPAERRLHMLEEYGTSYWYYYGVGD